MDFDWGHHHVIYHGWDRPGWVNNARPYVHVRNVYITRSRPFINQVWRHDRSHGDPARYLASRPSGPNAGRYARMGEARGSNTIQPGGGRYGQAADTRAYSDRGRESRGIVNQQPVPLAPSISRGPAVPTPNAGERPTMPPSGTREQGAVPTAGTSQRPTTPAPSISERPEPAAPRVGGSPPSQPRAARPEEVQPGRTPSVTFGGYRGANEAKAQSLRGQASRQSAERVRPFEPPASHGHAPAGGNISPGRQRQQR